MRALQIVVADVVNKWPTCATLSGRLEYSVDIEKWPIAVEGNGAMHVAQVVRFIWREISRIQCGIHHQLTESGDVLQEHTPFGCCEATSEEDHVELRLWWSGDELVDDFNAISGLGGERTTFGVRGGQLHRHVACRILAVQAEFINVLWEPHVLGFLREDQEAIADGFARMGGFTRVVSVEPMEGLVAGVREHVADAGTALVLPLSHNEEPVFEGWLWSVGRTRQRDLPLQLL